MVRSPSVDKNGIKKGAWSEEEDTILRAYVEKYGHWNWRQLPKYAGLARCGKSCRLRWLNYLKPGLKKGVYSKEEEELIVKLRDELGNRWSIIALQLAGRTDNEIKNYWHTHLRKKTQQDPKPSKLPTQENKNFSITKSKSNQQSQNRECVSSNDDSIDLEPSGSFWSEPFLLDTSNTMVSPSGSCNSTLLNTLASSKSFLESSGHFLEEPFSLDDYKNILEETIPNTIDDFQMDPFLLEASDDRFFPTNYDELYHVFSSSSSSSMDEGFDIPFSSSGDDIWL